MNTDNFKIQVALGLFIISGIVITMLMIVYMTGSIRLGGDAYYVLVEMENIGDLKIGAPVKFGGVEIGKVKNLSIEETHILITAGISGKYNIQCDSKPKISTMGLVGDAYLEFSRGVKHEYLAKIQDPAAAPRLVGLPTGGMGEMMVALQTIGREVEEMVRNVNALIGKAELRDHIEQSIANVAAATADISVLLQKFHDTLNRVNRAIDNVVTITAGAKNTIGSIDKFIGELFGNENFAVNLAAVLDNVRHLTEMLHQNEDFIAQTVRSLSSTAGNVAAITGSITPGQGLLRLLSDEQAGAEVMFTIQSLQRAARAIATVGLSDIVADKYIGDKIGETWLREHRGSSEKMAREWKAWMFEQKAYAARLNGAESPRVPAYYYAPPAAANSASPVPAGNENYFITDPADIESFYDPAPVSANEISSPSARSRAPRAKTPASKSTKTKKIAAAPAPESQSAPDRHPLESYYRQQP